MKKYSLFLFLTLLPVMFHAQMCELDTFPLPNDNLWGMKVIYCKENPTDTVRYGDFPYGFVYPYDLVSGASTVYFPVACDLLRVTIPEGGDSLYGVAMAGFFSTKDMDSLRVVFGALAEMSDGSVVLLDTVDFSNHYRVKLFEHYETDTAGKRNFYYPYFYEFYFDQPISLVDVDSLYIGNYRIYDNRHLSPEERMEYHQFPIAVAHGVPATWVNEGSWNYNSLYDRWSKGWPTFPWAGYVAIVAPDEVRCPRPAAPWLAAVDGSSATLQWDPCLCDSLQLELTPLDSLGFPAAPARTHIPQSDSLLTLHDLDTSRCYAARLRVQCHHQCPSHDTTLWSPWSDTLRFCLGTGGIDGLAAPAAPGLMPNPTDGPLTVETDGRATAIAVHDMAGRPVGGWRVEVLDDTRATLDVAPLRPGAYLLTVQTAAGSRTARFVRR